MKKLLGALMFLVIGVMFIPVVMNSIDNYDVGSGVLNYEVGIDPYDAGTINGICLDDNLEITSFYVNGTLMDYELNTDYYLTEQVNPECTGIWIEMENELVAEDIILVNYIYDLDVPAGVDGLINVVGILFVIGIVVGGVAYIKFSN